MVKTDCKFRHNNICECGLYDGMNCTLEDAIKNNPENYNEFYGKNIVQLCFSYKPIK
jgi:hypothetical protein